jgi:hypothetical protein
MMQPHPRSPFDSRNIIAQCQTELGWSAAYAAKVFDEYCKFLKLASMEHHQHAPTLRRGSMLIAPLSIEIMWRYHSLDTQQYSRDCQSICGGVIPYENDTSVDGATSRLQRFHDTMIAYQARFGEVPNPEVWKFGDTCSSPVSVEATESPQAQDNTNSSSSSTVTIRVRETAAPNQTIVCIPFESVFRMKARTPLHRVFDVMEARHRQGGSISFRFGGRDIDGNVSAHQLGMVNGDQITAVWRQPPKRGC